MSLGHLHLIINHLPIISIPLLILFLIFGIKTKNQSLIKFSLILTLILSSAVLAVNFTGEPAEELVEKLSGVTEHSIHEHEEAAEISVVLAIVTAVLSGLTLVFSKKEKLFQKMTLGLVVIMFLSAVSLGYTGYLGGQIRHTELSAPSDLAPIVDIEKD
jgi:uncharacterized membrane protein